MGNPLYHQRISYFKRIETICDWKDNPTWKKYTDNLVWTETKLNDWVFSFGPQTWGHIYYQRTSYYSKRIKAGCGWMDAGIITNWSTNLVWAEILLDMFREKFGKYNMNQAEFDEYLNTKFLPRFREL